MDLRDFVARVPNFDSLSHPEKIRLFAWHLHTHRSLDAVDRVSIKDCYREIDAVPPDLGMYLLRMAAKKPPELIRISNGRFRLEGSISRVLTDKYGEQKGLATVAKLLSDLPEKIPDVAERAFLSEALDCYRARAFRATTVMTWNLAFDHLLRWILSDAKRLTDFNAAISSVHPKKKPITRPDDFEEFKESEIIELCRVARLCSKNIIEILREKLKRRNAAAHPSQVVIGQYQVDDVITDLINNVVLTLK